MASSEKNVSNFLEDLISKSIAGCKKRMGRISELCENKSCVDQIEKWDTAYVSEKLKQAQLDLDERLLKPYFQLEKVKLGLFEVIVGKLYGLSFKKNKDIQVYHNEVEVYSAFNSHGYFHALLYTDFFLVKENETELG